MLYVSEHVGSVVGGVIGGLVGLALIVLLVALFVKSRRRIYSRFRANPDQEEILERSGDDDPITL